MEPQVPRMISINVNDRIFLKHPESSDLGRRIIKGSIELIDEVGFEAFTFKKLGHYISAPEASIYRYFENKHRLLLYLIAWYWLWMDLRLSYAMANIADPQKRLMKAIELLTSRIEDDSNFLHVDEVRLHHIVIAESSKTYLTREVDHENKEGVFLAYKQLVQRVSDVIRECNPQYKYPHMLVSTVIEGAFHQRYFAQHLPRLTDQLSGEDSVVRFYQDLVVKTISNVKA